MNLKLFTIILLFLSPIIVAQNKEINNPVEWREVDDDLFNLLYHEQFNFYELFKQTVSKQPVTLYDHYFHLNMYLRAGMTNEAIKTIKKLRSKNLLLDPKQITSTYYEIYDYEFWYVTKAYIETYADIISTTYSFPRELHYKKDWRIARIDRWLSRQPVRDDNFWFKERMYFNCRFHRESFFVKKLCNEIEKRHDNIEKVINILMIIGISNNIENYDIDFSWMISSIFPQHSTEALRIADILKKMKKWKEAAHFYQSALDMEFSLKDYNYLNEGRSRRVSKEILEVANQLYLKENLSKCLVKIDRKKEAHNLMMETIALSKKHHMRPNMLFAGETQRGTSIFLVEQEIIEKEEIAKDSIEYWKERVSYYRGRKKQEEIEKALLQGLNAVKKKYPRDTLYNINDYHYFFGSYCLQLNVTNRGTDAVKLYYDELRQIPLTSVWAKQIIGSLSDNGLFELPINVHDEILWEWLDVDQKWYYYGEDLLERLIEVAGKTDIDLVLNRAELLAAEYPFRSYILGGIVSKYPQRAIPLFNFAYKEIESDELKSKISSKLFNIYINVNDWKKAEQIFLDRKKNLSSKSIMSNLRYISLAAARAGDYAEALQIWGLVQNVNPSCLWYLQSLSEVGMSNLFIHYYNDMAHKLPASKIPKMAIVAIKSIEN